MPTGFWTRLPAYGLEEFSGYGRRRDIVEKLAQERLIRVDPEKADVHQFLTAYLFNEAVTELSPVFHPQLLAKALLAAAKAYNDGVAEKLVALIERSYGLVETRGLRDGSKPRELHAALERADKMFRQHLRELYWQLPDVRIVKVAGGARLEEPERHGTLLETKLAMLGHIIQDWMPQLTDESVGTFRFMIAASQSRPQSIPPREGESGYELKARGRFVSEDEHSGILRIVRDHVGTPPFSAETIELWLGQPMVPGEIQRVLAMARARHGGPELAKRDIRNAKLLKEFDPDRRSPDALRLLEALGESAARLDSKAQELPAMMQPDGGRANAEQIGASEYVLGEIHIGFDNLELIRVSVRLPDGCPEELARDVFSRARRHLDQWLLVNGWYRAQLWVTARDRKLDLHYPDEPGQYAGGPYVHPTA